MRENKTNILKEAYVFLITGLNKFRAYGAYVVGLEADSLKRLWLWRSQAYCQSSPPTKNLNKSISYHERRENIWLLVYLYLAETIRQGVQFHPEPNTDYGALHTASMVTLTLPHCWAES